MWTAHDRHIRRDGSVRARLFLIVDDHSRLLAGGRFYGRENARACQELLRRAITRRGLRLMARLSRWLSANGLGAADLTRGQVERYVAARRAEGRTSGLPPRSLDPILGCWPTGGRLSIEPGHVTVQCRTGR